MDAIENIIFDLGGVVIDLKRDCAVENLELLGITDAGKLLGEYAQKGTFLKLETGEIKSSEFYDELMALAAPGTTATQIRDAFERFLVRIPIERLRTLRELREAGYRLFVLSNTNPIMYHHWIEDHFRQEGMTVNDYFDGIVVSFQEGTCKPDPEIFKTVVRRYRLNPEETLMLDDSAANCEAARSVGLRAIQVKETGADTFSNICQTLLEEKGKK